MGQRELHGPGRGQVEPSTALPERERSLQRREVVHLCQASSRMVNLALRPRVDGQQDIERQDVGQDGRMGYE